MKELPFWKVEAKSSFFKIRNLCLLGEERQSTDLNFSLLLLSFLYLEKKESKQRCNILSYQRFIGKKKQEMQSQCDVYRQRGADTKK